MRIHRSAAVMLAAALFLSACGVPALPAVPSETPSAPPKPATATLAVSPFPPTATATLAPAPRTFTEGFDSEALYWSFLRAGAMNGPVTASTQAGALRLGLPGTDDWAYGLYAGQRYDDVRIDAVVDFGPAAGASTGVICRYNPAGGWYEFNIHPDGTFTILFGQWLAEGIARYLPLVVSRSEEIRATVNEIGLVCQDDVLTPYVNSVQLRRRQETQHVLTEGQVGVSAASADEGEVVISFDWISVGSP